MNTRDCVHRRRARCCSRARRPAMVIVTSLWQVQLRGTVCPQNFDDQTSQWLCFVDYWRTRYSLPRTLTVSALGAMLCYADLPSSYTFQPLAFETLGPLSSSTTVFLTELGRRLPASPGELRETAFLFQRFSIAVLRFNSVLIQETFDLSDGQPDL